MSDARLAGRALKRILEAELSDDPFGAALERIARIPPKQAVNPLFGFFAAGIRWCAGAP